MCKASFLENLWASTAAPFILGPHLSSSYFPTAKEFRSKRFKKNWSSKKLKKKREKKHMLTLSFNWCALYNLQEETQRPPLYTLQLHFWMIGKDPRHSLQWCQSAFLGGFHEQNQAIFYHSTVYHSTVSQATLRSSFYICSPGSHPLLNKKNL